MCIAGVLATLAHRSARPLEIRAVQASGSPSPPRRDARSNTHAGNFIGEAPWALSALPDCLVQQTVWRGGIEAALRRRVPRAALGVNGGTVLHYHNCTITVRARDAFVVRGADRFHIPPRTQFFITGRQLFMLRVGKHAELRAYETANM
ncbi:MAG: hypothetical protein M3160_00910 [Candidatus Eremiobacteraeota bacterium]|nr:hypothetical protein [Candidatus Eremiobacteraeota bacterium]